MVWNNGNYSLTTYNFETKECDQIRDFWVHPETKRKLKPEIVISDQESTKFAGYAQDFDDMREEGFLLFYERATKKNVAIKSNRLNMLESWACMETSLDGNVFFVGGDCEKRGVLVAFTFDSSLAPEVFIDVANGTKKCSSVTQISRIIGTDYLIVACRCNVLFYKYQDKKFEFLRAFEVGQTGDIVSISLRRNSLFVVDDEGKIFVRSSAKELETQGLYKRGGHV